MIPKDFVTEWRAHAPWVADRQVEHDLVISRALVELFLRKPIETGLAFRGGTALYKLHLRPAARYSEDIDLVQTAPGDIGPLLDEIHEALDSWLGKPHQRKKGRDLFDLAYALACGRVSAERVVACFTRYMAEGGVRVTRAMFEENLAGKRTDKGFTADMTPLLATGQKWSFENAFEIVARVRNATRRTDTSEPS